MTEQPPMVDTTELRQEVLSLRADLARLRRRLEARTGRPRSRRPSKLLLAALVATVALAALGAAGVEPFHIDADGNVRFGGDVGVTRRLVIYGANGKENFGVSYLKDHPDNGYLTVRDSQGSSRVSAFVASNNAGQVNALGPNGKVNVSLEYLNDKHPNNGYVGVRNSEGDYTAALYVGSPGTGQVQLRGPNGKENVILAYSRDHPNHGFVGVRDSAGVDQASMYVDDKGEGYVSTKNLEATDVWSNVDFHNKRLSNYKGFPKPDKNCDWSNETTNRVLTCPHGFGSLPSMVQVWVRSNNKGNAGGVHPEDITSWKMAGVLSLWESHDSFGVVAEAINEQQVILRTGNKGLWHGARANNWFNRGDVRLRIWR